MIALVAPLVVALVGAPTPDAVDSSSLSPVFGTPSGPGSAHWFGVDWLGRDVFSRTLYGARVSLFVGLVTTIGAVALGVVLGLVAGFRGGLLDTVVSRMTEAFLVIPYLLLALGIAASCSSEQGCVNGTVRPGIPLVILVLIVTSWPALARIIRNETLSLRERDFVSAARLSGASSFQILGRELLPNLLPVIAVMTVVLAPQMIIAEAALSYLGVGVTPPTPSWGGMIASAAPAFPDAWWLMLFPGIGLVATVLCCTLLADRLRRGRGPSLRIYG
ncbi:MAG: ABC transporter permease [Solirubrobacterales bacterium]|nr:ABC transporter permease [Solirubrobacterales bacterium]